MISRRSIRVKVLQALYSQFLVKSDNEKETIEVYDNSIQEVLEVNLCYLLYAKNILGYVKDYADQQSNKFLISELEKSIDSSLLNSTFFKYFSENELFLKSIKKFKSENYIQSEFVRAMFFDLIKSKEYKTYLSDKTGESEYNLLNFLFKKILFSNEELASYLESYFGNVNEDADLVHFTLKRSIKSILEGKNFSVSLGFAEMKELRDFAINLIKINIKHQSEFLQMIEPKLIGWDADRIPVLDMTILKMSISEMLYFPTIPLKVTVNEYVDLSKMFCSLKSKDFINGVIDRIMKELQSDGKIVKTGRGLE